MLKACPAAEHVGTSTAVTTMSPIEWGIIIIIIIRLFKISGVHSYCFWFDWAKSINFKSVSRVPMHVF